LFFVVLSFRCSLSYESVSPPINHPQHAVRRGANNQLVSVNLGGGELGDGLGTLGDGVLGELTGEHEADGGLDLPGGEGGLLVVGGELAGLGGDALEDVVDEGVHDGHALLGDAGVGVDLLEDLVDVGGVALDALLLGAAGGLLGCLGSLLGALGWSLGHG